MQICTYTCTQKAWQAGEMLYITMYVLKWCYDAWRYDMKYYIDSDDNKEWMICPQMMSAKAEFF